MSGIVNRLEAGKSTHTVAAKLYLLRLISPLVDDVPFYSPFLSFSLLPFHFFFQFLNGPVDFDSHQEQLLGLYVVPLAVRLGHQQALRVARDCWVYMTSGAGA